jgi:soluble lytic murein transglycosylase-like protein
VYFTSGRTLSVKAHRDEGAMIVLMPRTGGEITVDRTFIARIGPDEVPYPDPPVPAAQANASDIEGGEPGVLPRPEYEPHIARASAQHGVDPALVRAVIHVESRFERRARSPKGAMGLMQLMPATARQYAVRDPYDPAANIDAGTRHLKSLLDRFPLSLALAAYNAGEAAVQRYGGIPPYPETQSYVSRVLRLIR